MTHDRVSSELGDKMAQRSSEIELDLEGGLSASPKQPFDDIFIVEDVVAKDLDIQCEMIQVGSSLLSLPALLEEKRDAHPSVPLCISISAAHLEPLRTYTSELEGLLIVLGPSSNTDVYVRSAARWPTTTADLLAQRAKELQAVNVMEQRVADPTQDRGANPTEEEFQRAEAEVDDFVNRIASKLNVDSEEISEGD